MYGIIYKSKNKINGKVYIGQTVRDFGKRIKEHIRKSFSGEYNGIFAKAIVKYGEENFSWELIDFAESKEELDKKEIYWIYYYNTYRGNNGHGYNMTIGGNGVGRMISEQAREKMSKSRIGKKHSEETKKKMRINNPRLSGKNHPHWNKKQSKETIEKKSKALKGNKLSEETKMKLSIAHKGKKLSDKHVEKIRQAFTGEGNPMFGKSHSQETKDKISSANKGRLAGANNPSAKAVVKLSKDGEFIEYFPTAKEGALSVNGDISTIIKCCKGKSKSHKGFKWVYEKDYLNLKDR